MQQPLGSKQESFYKGRGCRIWGGRNLKDLDGETAVSQGRALLAAIGELVPLPMWQLSHCLGPLPASSWLEGQLSARSEGSRQVGRLLAHTDDK